jgi:hypothetical protein
MANHSTSDAPAPEAERCATCGSVYRDDHTEFRSPGASFHRWNPAPEAEQRDACETCDGTQGVPGNENVIERVVMCDYCHARLMDRRNKPATAPPPSGASSDNFIPAEGWMLAPEHAKKEIDALRAEKELLESDLCENGHHTHAECSEACSCWGQGKSLIEQSEARADAAMAECDRLTRLVSCPPVVTRELARAREGRNKAEAELLAFKRETANENTCVVHPKTILRIGCNACAEAAEAERDGLTKWGSAEQAAHLSWKASAHATLEKVRELRAERDALARIVEEVAAPGVEFDDDRCRYVAVQLDRNLWDEMKTKARAEEGK